MIQNTNSKKEAPFEGNSVEFRIFLRRKQKELKEHAQKIRNLSSLTALNRKIEEIEEVLTLPYFERGICLSMPYLIELIKNDRNEMKEKRPKQEEYEKATVGDRILCERADAFRAKNPWADEKNSPELKEMRDEHDEYCCTIFEYERLGREIRTRWQLLGMIHRPNGYFQLAFNLW